MVRACPAFVPRRLVSVALVVCGLLWPFVPPSWGDFVPCNDDSSDTCNCRQLIPDCGNAQSGPRKNIFLLIADDDAYCHMGFMQGMCLSSTLGECDTSASAISRDRPSSQAPVHVTNGKCPNGQVCVDKKCFKPCRTNLGCPGQTDRCASSAEVAKARGHDPHTVPLRLADPTCRSRSAMKENRVRFTNVRGIFQFDPQYPRPTDGAVQDAHAFTPHLDTLAGGGAVFPFAHSGGMECKAARTVFWNGLFNKHLLVSGFDDPTPASAELNTTCDPSVPGRFSGVGCYLHNLSSRCIGGTGSCSGATGRGHGCPCTSDGQCSGTTCSRPSYCAGGTGNCTTAPFGPGCPCSVGNDCESKHCAQQSEYFTYLWGKEDISSINQGDLDGGGGTQTGNIDENVCGAEERCDDVAHGLVVIPGSMKQVQNIFETIETDVSQSDHSLRNPFMVWYSPNIPHLEKPVPENFKRLYPDERELWSNPSTGQKDVLAQLARMALFDAGVGEVVDGLKRRCFCDANKQPASLYDRTVLIYVNDNGNRSLPFAKRQPTDNGDRSAIIINEPRLRKAPPRALPDYASGIDLIATMVSYAEETPDPPDPFPNPMPPPSPDDCGQVSYRDPSGGETKKVEFAYPYLRNLCRIVRGAPAPALGPSRKAYVSHHAKISLDTGGTKIRGLLTAPGQLGVCGPAANTKQEHRRPCREDSDCVGFKQPETRVDFCHFGLGTCNCPSVSVTCTRDSDCATCGGNDCVAPAAMGGRCANDLSRACALDEDCAVDASNASLCSGQSCANGQYQYPEFAGRHCDSPADCVPPRVCQPPLLKVLVGPKGTGENLCDPMRFLTDLNFDPDQKHNLIDAGPQANGDPDYLSDTLRKQLLVCLRQYWDPCARRPEESPTQCHDPGQADMCSADSTLNTAYWLFCPHFDCGDGTSAVTCPFAEPPFGLYGPEPS